MPSATDRLKIRHLHMLVAVAEQGSLARAAEALAITQPAVSKSLAELEDIVGKRLFDRSFQGVKLTEAGHVLLRHAGASLRAIREGLNSLEHQEEAAPPPLLIGALPNVAATVLPPALLRFAEAMPRVQVTVRTGSNAQMIAALKQGVLDLVIGRLAEPSEMQGLSFEQLYTERLVMVVRPGHPLAGMKRVSVEALREYRFVLPDAGTRVREAADRWFVASGLGQPVRSIETIDLAFGRSYVQQSDAVWFVPEGAVTTQLLEGRLHKIEFNTAITEGPVGLTLKGQNEPTSASASLIIHLLRNERLRICRESHSHPKIKATCVLTKKIPV